MAEKNNKMLARLPRGFVDRTPDDIRAMEKMTGKIRQVFELYGFEPADQPLIEYTDALGKFLPDQDRPNEGVFSFQDDDEQWLSLRYDLTAPMARYVAENFEKLPKPFRSYRSGWVFRNEKPGPGRFRQFMQFDADTVGTPQGPGSVAADAEMAMMMADTMEALGVKRGDYVIRVNNRKVLDGVLEAIGLGGDENAGRRLIVLRSIDKLDKVGVEGVRQLLGAGRWEGGKEGEGDFTRGAGLDEDKAALVLLAVTGREAQNLPPVTVEDLLDGLDLGSEENRERRRLALRAINKLNELGLPAVRKALGPGYDDASGEFAIGVGLKDFYVECLLRTAAPELFGDEPRETDLDLVGATTIRFQVASYKEGVAELEEIQALVRAAGYGEDRIKIDPSVVRGLEYYTGPVFEAELLAEIPNEDGQIVRFGSVGGGGRYDGLVSRFRGEPVPATGFSIGVSRLMTALKNLGKLDTSDIIAPVVVLVMDKDTESLGRYQKMVGELRAAGIRAEMYLGGAGMKAQMKYADRRGAPCVIIQGGNEREEGTVQIKDLVVGAKLAAGIADHDAYKEARPGQVTVPEADLVAAVRGILDAQKVERG